MANYADFEKQSSNCNAVLILGHSYIRRLRDYCVVNKIKNFNLPDDSVSVILHGIGGAKVQTLLNELDVIDSVNPDTVILQIGGNDLCFSTPILVFQDIIKLTDIILSCKGVNHVYVCQLTFRENCRDGYNHDVEVVNDMLEHHLLNNSEPCPGIHFWYHGKGLNSRWPHLYNFDGVHLSDVGLKKYYKSLRGTVITSLSLYA